MFKDRSFNKAFFISLSWHLFILFFVTIVVVPKSFQKPKIYTVSFLGPILEKTAFEMMLERNVEPKNAIYEQPMTLEDRNLNTIGEASHINFTDSLLAGGRKAPQTSTSDLFEDSKISPPFQHVDSDIKEEAPKTENFLIEGPLAKREIVFKPEMPVVPQRIGSGKESFIVELKAEVLSTGSVEKITLLASSGYPDIDLEAIKYVKKLKFSPLNPAPEETVESGQIKINLKSK